MFHFLIRSFKSNNKAKDLQLKRSTEIINRLKSENEELTVQAQVRAHTIVFCSMLIALQSGSSGDKAKLDEMTTRVRNLEKQRGDLIEAFRKQMKLIDILKRQKVRFSFCLIMLLIIMLFVEPRRSCSTAQF